MCLVDKGSNSAKICKHLSVWKNELSKLTCVHLSIIKCQLYVS